MSSEVIVPDTKDWTWVLERTCPECGYDAAGVALDRLPELLRANAATWAEVLARPDAVHRRAPGTWSPLEYGCHVRDVHGRMGERLRLMLAEDDPRFADWDQDRTAREDRYDEQDPAVVGRELAEAAERVAHRYGSVPPDAWDRPGTRSNGSVFTVASLGRYRLHDVVHHAWGVRTAPAPGRG